MMRHPGGSGETGLKPVQLSLAELRHHAIASSLFAETTIAKAISKLGFVQADPIRSPARAQDLILRQRVKNFRVGDLDQQYGRLRLEEDYLYAYGFMPSTTWQLLHPREMRTLKPAEQEVLDLVTSRKKTHPRDLEKHFGKSREINAWGGYSKSTTRILERLHYLGLLRIAGRSDGVKLYEATEVTHEPLAPDERLQQLALLIARILAPISEASLRAALGHLRHSAPHLPGRLGVIAKLQESGALDHAEVEGIIYLWPAGRIRRTGPLDGARFLSPFDPIVWDRRRFEHFWKWPYRFEAYTPAAKRKHGYYALPLLWKEEVIGWVNVTGTGESLQIDAGYVTGRSPTGRGFRDAFAAESERLMEFLRPRLRRGA